MKRQKPPFRPHKKSSTRPGERAPAPGESPRRTDRPLRSEGPKAPGIKNPYVRFHKLVKPPMQRASTTLWDYPSQHYGTGEQGSQYYRGATPSWVIWQALTLWTKEGDTVVDPFCGSGTTLDVCTDLGRKGRGFDLKPFRKDIELGDARKLPVQDRSVELVFFDPPYADNLTYSEDPSCIGKLHAEDGSWGRAMTDVIKDARRVLRPDGHLVMFVCDVLHAKNGKRTFHPLGLQLAMIAEDQRMDMVDHAVAIRHGKALESGAGKQQAEREGFLLRGFSHVLVFQRPR